MEPGIVGWLVVLGLAALLDSISVYIRPSPREREKEERKPGIDCLPCSYTKDIIVLSS